jgi:hypothetical protein
MDCLYHCNNSNSRWESSFKANPHHFKMVYLGFFVGIGSSVGIQKCAYNLYKV